MRDYLYFSERLARAIIGDNCAPRPSTRAVTFAARPFGIGGDVSFSSGTSSRDGRHDTAELVDKIVGDRAPAMWEPNGCFGLLRGRSSMFLGELISAPTDPLTRNSAMIGSSYSWEGETVNLCLFGSRHNLDGAVPEVDDTRRSGWFSSSNVGVRALWSLIPKKDEWDEESAFGTLRDVDQAELVQNAANIMRGQGSGHPPDFPDAPSLRGYTILEGHFEWLARIYFSESGDSRFGHVAVGAPIYIRTYSEPWSVYGPVPAGKSVGELPLESGRMTLDPEIDAQRATKRRLRWRRAAAR